VHHPEFLRSATFLFCMHEWYIYRIRSITAFSFARANSASRAWHNLSYRTSSYGSCVCCGTFKRDIQPDREPQMLSECDAAGLEDSQGLTVFPQAASTMDRVRGSGGGHFVLALADSCRWI